MEREEEYWENFVRTGRVADYLEYARMSHTNSVKEERGQREGTSDGDGALGSRHR